MLRRDLLELVLTWYGTAQVATDACTKTGDLLSTAADRTFLIEVHSGGVADAITFEVDIDKVAPLEVGMVVAVKTGGTSNATLSGATTIASITDGTAAEDRSVVSEKIMLGNTTDFTAECTCSGAPEVELSETSEHESSVSMASSKLRSGRKRLRALRPS